MPILSREARSGDSWPSQILNSGLAICPLVSKEGQDGDSYTPVTHFIDHSKYGCPKCSLLREIISRYKKEFGWSFSDSDWTTLRFRNKFAEPFAVDVFVPQGKPKLFQELKHRPPIGEIPYEDSLEKAKTWMLRCSEQHKSCQATARHSLPRRLIQISADEVRLIESDRQTGPYIALSHCWGDSRPQCVTTKSTIAANMRGVEWESIPRTFQDAIKVCQKLGIEYLWIDSLCIIQDDELDWSEESAKMASVYHGSYLTICATSAEHDNTGLWTESLERAPVTKIVVKINSQDFQIYSRLRNDSRAVHLDGNLNDKVRPKLQALNPLLSRGWTFQERLIAPRLLHFGYGELLWQCPEVQTCECCFDEEPNSLSYMARSEEERRLFSKILHDTSGNNTTDSWRLFIQNYSALQLTFQKDILPALSGVAKMCLERRPGDRYLAGLWEKSLIHDLVWFPLYGGDQKPRPKVFRAPSWSWASTTQQVTFFDIGDVDSICAKVLSASTVLAGSDPTGEVVSGSLVLIAPVEWAVMSKVIPGCFYVHGQHTNHDIMFRFDAINDVEDFTIEEGNSVLCLRLNCQTGKSGYSRIMLALVPIDGRPGVYRRVGITMVSRGQDFTDGSFAQEMEVEII